MKALRKIIKKNLDEEYYVDSEIEESCKDIEFVGGQVVEEDNPRAVLVSNREYTNREKQIILCQKAKNIVEKIQYLGKGMIASQKDEFALYTEGVRAGWGAKAYLVVFGLLLAVVSTYMPGDSLLLDMVGYKYNYNYNNMFIETLDFPGGTYAIFDHLAGWFDQTFGGSGADILPAQIFRALIFGLVLSGIAANVRDKDDATGAAIAVFAVFLTHTRLLLGRPCLVSTGCLFWAMALHEKRRYFGYLLVFASSFLYWLGFIYAAPLFLFSPIYLFAGLLGTLCHSVVMGPDFLENLRWLFQVEAISTTPFQISELIPLPKVFLSFTWVVLGINIVRLSQQLYSKLGWRETLKRNRAGIIALYFSLPFMARYIEIIAPLLVINIQDELSKWLKRFIPWYGIRFVIAICLLISYFEVVVARDAKIYPFEYIPPEIVSRLSGQRVLTDKGGRVAKLIFAVPDIKMGPVFDQRVSNAKTQNLVFKLEENGDLDCSVLKGLSFDWLVEDSLVSLNRSPECLEWSASYRGVRVWKIRKL